MPCPKLLLPSQICNSAFILSSHSTWTDSPERLGGVVVVVVVVSAHTLAHMDLNNMALLGQPLWPQAMVDPTPPPRPKV